MAAAPAPAPLVLYTMVSKACVDESSELNKLKMQMPNWMMKSKLKMRCQQAHGLKPSQSKLTPEQSSHLDWCLSDEAMQAADCRAPSDHSEPGTHVNNDENPSSPNKRLRVDATSPCGCHIATVSLRLRDDGVPVTLCLRGLNIQFKVTE